MFFEDKLALVIDGKFARFRLADKKEVQSPFLSGLCTS